MQNIYLEQIFFHYILDNPLFLSVAKSEYFANTNIRELFDIAKEHALRYKEPPSKDQMMELLRVKGLGEKYSVEIVEGLYNTKVLLSQYDDEWLENNVGPWIQVRNLDNVMRKAIAFMKTTKVTAENASEVVEKIRHMLVSETVIDFSFNLGSDFFDPTAHLQTRLARTATGYDYIDLCLKGGWWKGSLIVFLSGPKSGKCVVGDTKIKIKSKKTGKIKLIEIEKFHNMIKFAPNVSKFFKYMKRKIKDKKFKEVFDVNDWEVETEDGFKPIVASGKTILYDVWMLKLENSLSIKCADSHIVINDKNEEIYIKDLSKSEYLLTKRGKSKVSSVEKIEASKENMYDIEIDSKNHTYYTNDILSHNSMWLGNLALASVQQGHNTAYVTFELQEEIINMRIGSNMFTIPIDDYEEWAKDQNRLKTKIQQAKQSAVIPLGILHTKEFGASTCSVNDLRT